MGAFDDLIPQSAKQKPISTGAFDDLIPSTTTKQPDVAAPVEVQQPIDISGISENAVSFLQGARSDVPFAQRVETYKANIAQGMPEKAALESAAFGSQGLGETISEGLEFAKGIPGLIPSVASSAVLEPVAGIAGIAQAVNPFAEEGAGARAVEAVRGLAIDPIGEAAQKTGQTISQAFEPVGEVLKAPAEATLEATGSPAAAAAVETATLAVPELITARLGLKGVKKAGKGVESKVEKVRAKRLEKVQSVLDNPQSAKNVEFRIVSGRRRPDKLAKQALKQGFNAPTVAFAKSADKVDKAKFSEMLDIKERALSDPKFASTNRPSDVVGRSVSDRVKHLLTVNKSAGQQIDKVASTLEGRSVNLKNAKDSFIQKLQKEGVTVSEDGGVLQANFDGSSFSGLDAPQNAINQMLDRLNSLGESSDALQAHRAKRFIDENITLGGKSGEGLKGRSQNIILDLRKNIDDTLDSEFRNYKRVNDTYSKTINALDDFQKAAGTKIELEGENLDKAAGILSRRLLSNAASSTNLYDAIKNLDDITALTGGKFKDDIVSQAMFADILDSAFGTSAQRSLSGEVGKAVTGPQVTRAVEAPVSATIEAVFGKIQEIRGINQDKAFKSMKVLLSR